MDEPIPPPPWMTDPATRAVIAALEAAGGPDCARFVGGCVRDSLLDRPVLDIDIATRLTPSQTAAALEAAGLRAVPTGVEHGTVTAISERRPFEITTLRRDVETDGRRAVVAFTTDWAQDAARRDFRLNALYLDRDGVIHDPVGGGVADARAGRIVFVGDAAMRIREDYLRVLRFFRFFAWYGRGEPDADALAACSALKDGVATLSGERVAKELLKLLAAPDPRAALRLMERTGVLAVLLPLAPNLPRFEAMVGIEGDPVLRLAALMPDAPDAALDLARRLRLSNPYRDRLATALDPTPALSADLTPPQVRRALYRLGAQRFGDRVRLAWAASGGPAEPWRGLLAQAEGWTRPAPPVTGADAKRFGVAQGPALGTALRAVLDWWIEADFPDDRAAAIARLEAAIREAKG
ncbi:MAG TPA: CCA tRNA nucleotidyltransferase [Caulobacteraceae bacterium]|jgi:poly(A) polymerase|nr:CCA tRNA nucleotidyltransferase [Caulobacteraceae bacterium]